MTCPVWRTFLPRPLPLFLKKHGGTEETDYRESFLNHQQNQSKLFSSTVPIIRLKNHARGTGFQELTDTKGGDWMARKGVVGLFNYVNENCAFLVRENNYCQCQGSPAALLGYSWRRGWCGRRWWEWDGLEWTKLCSGQRSDVLKSGGHLYCLLSSYPQCLSSCSP